MPKKILCVAESKLLAEPFMIHLGESLGLSYDFARDRRDAFRGIESGRYDGVIMSGLLIPPALPPTPENRTEEARRYIIAEFGEKGEAYAPGLQIVDTASKIGLAVVVINLEAGKSKEIVKQHALKWGARAVPRGLDIEACIEACKTAFKI